MLNENHTNQRRTFVITSSLTNNFLHFKYPLMPLWWSFVFPGFGHYMTNSFIWGFILMSTEFIINTISHINVAIYLSMIGEIEKAKEVIDTKYFFVYIAIYVFAAWDSYRRGVELNQEYQLAYRNQVYIKPFNFSALEVNPLRKKQPVVGVFWALVFTPAAYIYLHRIPSVLFSFFWWGVLFFKSNIQRGFYYTMIGKTSTAIEVLNPQWILYFPSIICFAMYDVYSRIIENNKIYEIELSRYLQENFQEGSLKRLF